MLTTTLHYYSAAGVMLNTITRRHLERLCECAPLACCLSRPHLNAQLDTLVLPVREPGENEGQRVGVGVGLGVGARAWSGLVLPVRAP